MRHPHGALGAPPQFSARFLLQGGGGERGGWALGEGLLGDAGHARTLARQGVGQVVGGVGIEPRDIGGAQGAGVIEVFAGGDAHPVEGHQSGAEITGQHTDVEVPIFGGTKRDPLPLPLHQQPDRHTLHSAG